MNGQNRENLKELFERFVGAEQADKAAEDIWRAEQIFREHPAPQPGKELIAGIKSDIASSLLLRQRNIFRRKVSYEVAAVAAAVIVLAAIGIKLFEKGGGKGEKMYASLIPAAMWESGNIAVDDPRIASLTADVEQIESEVLTLREGEYGGNGDKAVTELEMEVAVASNSL
jgi:ferric-dicitrate binding protein FerR (iron transport regulator)